MHIHDQAKQRAEPRTYQIRPCGWSKKVRWARNETFAEPFGVIHFWLVFLPNTKGFRATSELQFLPICRFAKLDEFMQPRWQLSLGEPLRIYRFARFVVRTNQRTFGSWLSSLVYPHLKETVISNGINWCPWVNLVLRPLLITMTCSQTSDFLKLVSVVLTASLGFLTSQLKYP